MTFCMINNKIKRVVFFNKRKVREMMGEMTFLLIDNLSNLCISFDALLLWIVDFFFLLTMCTLFCLLSTLTSKKNYLLSFLTNLGVLNYRQATSTLWFFSAASLIIFVEKSDISNSIIPIGSLWFLNLVL